MVFPEPCIFRAPHAILLGDISWLYPLILSLLSNTPGIVKKNRTIFHQLEDFIPDPVEGQDRTPGICRVGWVVYYAERI